MRIARRSTFGGLLAWLAVSGCASARPTSGGESALGSDAAADTSACPARATAPIALPRVEAEERSLDYWLGLAAQRGDADAVVLTPEDIAIHNAAFPGVGRDALGAVDLTAPVDGDVLRDEVNDPLVYLSQRIASGEYVDRRGAPLSEERARRFVAVKELPPLAPTLRVVLEATSVRCGPDLDGLFKGPTVDERFDRGLCTTLQAQEPVRVLAAWPGGLLLVRTAYALGWISATAQLSPPVPDELEERVARGARLRLRAGVELAGEGGAHLITTEGQRLVEADGQGRALFATDHGFATSGPLAPGDARPTRRALSRRALLQEAFSYLDTPYGWGGAAGGRDCSSLLRDVFEAFDLHLPRNSGAQARYGSFAVELDPSTSVSDKLALADAAAKQGVVLLHLPGHVMLYLGRDRGGRAMVLHSFAEYTSTCPAGGETLHLVDRVQVSDLELGAGTSRGSLAERLTHLTVFGRDVPDALAGVVIRRPAAPLSVPETGACHEGDEASLLVSPAIPAASAPVRVVVTSPGDLGAVAMVLVGPDGQRHVPELHRTGGPPFGYWIELEAPVVGTWTAAIGEGGHVASCRRFKVTARGAKRRAGDGAVWRPRGRWSAASERLWSTFVEQLFAYGADDDRTWPDLGALLGTRDKNILFDHLGQGEDTRLALQPDCADLPFVLRAYFAWKLRLPFGFHRCNRGASDRPPTCDAEVVSNLEERAARDEVEAFAAFARRTVGDGVHSGSARTAPADSRTDLYPVALDRASLTPGTVFADPYGHVLIIAGWQPQPAAGAGWLVGAEAQPDGTIGRRRFWQGSFLFTPDTTAAGAGFKAFRPLRYRGDDVRAAKNGAIAAPFVAFSEGQYALTSEQFYDRVQSLASPRPLAPSRALAALVDALAEQAERRVLSVHNVERHFGSGGGVIEMPRGASIFETTGPWEDYSTPSRDMRLLIAIDTVLDFPASLRRAPERFGLAPERAEVEARAGAERLPQELAARRFHYERSDGTRFEISLRDVVERRGELEVAYDPNDCPEIRWAAPDGSDERSTCGRRAPDGQRARMQEMRPWFAERKRPAR